MVAPISHNLQVLDATTTVVPDYRELKEVTTGTVCAAALAQTTCTRPPRPSAPLAVLQVALFLTQPGVLPADVGLALYVSIGGADWSYRGERARHACILRPTQLCMLLPTCCLPDSPPTGPPRACRVCEQLAPL